MARAAIRIRIVPSLEEVRARRRLRFRRFCECGRRALESTPGSHRPTRKLKAGHRLRSSLPRSRSRPCAQQTRCAVTFRRAHQDAGSSFQQNLFVLSFVTSDPTDSARLCEHFLRARSHHRLPPAPETRKSRRHHRCRLPNGAQSLASESANRLRAVARCFRCRSMKWILPAWQATAWEFQVAQSVPETHSLLRSRPCAAELHLWVSIARHRRQLWL